MCSTVTRATARRYELAVRGHHSKLSCVGNSAANQAYSRQGTRPHYKCSRIQFGVPARGSPPRRTASPSILTCTLCASGRLQSTRVEEWSLESSMRGRTHTASIHVSPACLAPLHRIDALDKESDDPSLMSYVKGNAGPRRPVILSKSKGHSGGSIMDGARMISVVITDTAYDRDTM